MNSSVAIAVQSLGAGLQQIEAGGYFSAARAADGSVYFWGDNDKGEIGNNMTALFLSSPQAISNTCP